MSTLILALGVMLGVWLGYRIGLWWTRRSLNTLIDQRLAQQGLQVSDELAALLRRPTVDGVARKMIKKMGLCAHADLLLGGVPMTIVCHDKGLLQRALDGIDEEKKVIEGHMATALAKANADNAIAHLERNRKVPLPAAAGPGFVPSSASSGANTGKPEFHAPPLPEPKVPVAPFKVIDGGVK